MRCVSIASPSISIASFATLSATSIKVVAQDDGTTSQTELGASGVTATIGASGGPQASVSNGTLGIVDGLSSPGLSVELRAEMDLLVLVSNCPQINNPCNGFEPTPVRVVVVDG